MTTAAIACTSLFIWSNLNLSILGDYWNLLAWRLMSQDLIDSVWKAGLIVLLRWFPVTPMYRKHTFTCVNSILRCHCAALVFSENLFVGFYWIYAVVFTALQARSQRFSVSCGFLTFCLQLFLHFWVFSSDYLRKHHLVGQISPTSIWFSHSPLCLWTRYTL